MAHYITDSDLFKDKKDKVEEIEEIEGNTISNKTEYLYGTKNIEHVSEEFIKYRIQKLNEHLTKLLNVHFTIRDTARINSVIKAISFWNKIEDN